MRASGTSRRGFTLLEVSVALLVVGLAATTALSAFAADARAAVRTRESLVAAALAQQRMAVLQLAVSDGVARRLPDSLARGSFPAPLDSYTWRATMTAVGNEPGLVALHVEVRGRDARVALDSRWFAERLRSGG